jgi:hypothetical protein
MPTSLQWTDASGAATLTNGKPAPGDRFTAWTPFTAPIGPRYAALGTGVLFSWAHRIDYGASFQLVEIPRTSLDLVMRLVRHLIAGGVVTVNTGDSAARVYSAGLRPETEPRLERSDRQNIEYTLSLELINRTGADMLCTYP